jgi:segregation and condensation protein B
MDAMNDDPTPELPDDSASTPESAGDLGRSLDSLLNGPTWEVDTDGNELLENGTLPAEAAPPPAPIDAPDPEVEDAVPPPPERIVEALLFVGGPPLTAARACDAVRGLTEAQFLQAIEVLNAGYRKQGRPCMIQAHGHGYILALRPRFKPVMERLFGSVREARLSTVAIDVLALVAYRQPATKQEIDSIRGAESGPLLRQLVRRGLISVVQRGDAGQREVSYGTTAKFLHFFGLKSLDDLPQTQDLQML